MNKKKEELSYYLGKQRQLQLDFETARTALLSFNKIFDEWLQDTLSMKDKKGQVHLTEILSAWDSLDDQA